MRSAARNATPYSEAPATATFRLARKRISIANQWRLLIAALGLNDLILIGAAFWAAYLVRFRIPLPFFNLDVLPVMPIYYTMMAILLPTWLLLIALTGSYNRQNILWGSKEYGSIFNAITLGMFLVMSIGFMQPELFFARGWLLLTWAFGFIFTALGRFVIRRIVYRLRARGYLLTNTVLVGANEEGLMLAEQLLNVRMSGLNLMGFIQDGVPAGTPLYKGVPALGPLANLGTILHQYGIREIILSSSALTREEVLEIFKNHGMSDGVGLHMSSGLYEIVTTGLHVTEFASAPLVGINKVRLTGIDEKLKLLLDYGIAIPAMLLLLPVMAVIAIAIRLDSPGPIIHRRRVMGVNGKSFDAFKFRTMFINGDEILASNPGLQEQLDRDQKLKDDPRITRMGRRLRKWSLDELPQIFNVLRNEMSIVGPRMIAPNELEKYSQFGINLLTVRPGITGLWQVSGRSDLSYAQRVRLDMYYVRNWSIWLDLDLVVKTIPAVLSRRGAY